MKTVMVIIGDKSFTNVKIKCNEIVNLKDTLTLFANDVLVAEFSKSKIVGFVDMEVENETDN